MGQLRKRARRPEDKEARRQAILAGARVLFEGTPYREIRMADVARRAGLAKGTVYLYFPTKEALFVAILRAELEGWLAGVEGAFGALAPGTPPRRVAKLLAASVASRPRLRRLLALLHGVLEENLAAAELRGFKRFLRDGVVRAGAALEAAAPGLAGGRGAELVLRLHALAIGIQSMADPSAPARRALRDPELALFDVAFEPMLSRTLSDLVAGMLEPKGRVKT